MHLGFAEAGAAGFGKTVDPVQRQAQFAGPDGADLFGQFRRDLRLEGGIF